MLAELKGVWKLQLKILFNIVGQPRGASYITSASGVILLDSTWSWLIVLIQMWSWES